MFSPGKRLLCLPGSVALVAALTSSAHAQTLDTSTAPAPPTASASSSIAAPAPGSPRPHRRKPRLRLGPNASVFVASDRKTRDRFGGSRLNLGVGLGSIKQARAKGELSGYLAPSYLERGDNHALLVPVGLRYRRALTEGTTFAPYVGVSLDLDLVDLRSVPDNVHSGVRAAAGGSAFAGFNVGSRGYFEAGYRAVSKIKGFNLSGVSLSAGLRF